ncbi:AraC family transcriptional regulator [Paenibacillus sp. FSL R7-0331]|uniref:AraC family transcriptional regulator n=1 Tax=Paenibacillus sp. FSL R7-0331 TaxID=1536773 RepID=UPI0004F91C70|nr:helix-turn-helix domain-containing protein [Paenibacillus sp. FSL R7-0331]AIQ51921.1 AraC family transcriptional regulator [Paenibacillus sp. FSL R7-0331]
MDHYLLETINRTTDFIEEHLLDPLCLDDISDHVNVSKFHLLRIWKGATATGLMEYVRRRRIARSLGDLLNQRDSITFISDKYGFSCERTYNRSFKEEFGITPAKWRRSPSPLGILDRFNADFMSRAGEGLVFFRSISVVPSFSIAGPEYTLMDGRNADSVDAARLGVDFFTLDRQRILNPVQKDVYFGFTAIPNPFRGLTFYQPSLQISRSSIIPPDMNVRHTKPHKYGVFTYIGLHRPEEISADSLSEIWKYIFEVWMPTVHFELEEKFSYESVNYAKGNRHYCECDLYFPITGL